MKGNEMEGKDEIMMINVVNENRVKEIVLNVVTGVVLGSVSLVVAGVLLAMGWRVIRWIGGF